MDNPEENIGHDGYLDTFHQLEEQVQATLETIDAFDKLTAFQQEFGIDMISQYGRDLLESCGDARDSALLLGDSVLSAPVSVTLVISAYAVTSHSQRRKPLRELIARAQQTADLVQPPDEPIRYTMQDLFKSGLFDELDEAQPFSDLTPADFEDRSVRETFIASLLSGDTNIPTPRDCAALLAQKYVRAVGFFKQPEVVDKIAETQSGLKQKQAEAGTPASNLKESWHPVCQTEPWLQALAIPGSMVETEEEGADREHEVTVELMLISKELDGPRKKVRGLEGISLKQEPLLEPTALSATLQPNPFTRFDSGLVEPEQKQMKGDLVVLRDELASSVTHIKTLISAAVDSLKEEYLDQCASLHQLQSGLEQSLIGKQYTSPEELHRALAQEELIASQLEVIWKKRLSMNARGTDTWNPGTRPLHGFLRIAAQIEHQADNEAQIEANLLAMEELRARYRVPRAKFKDIVDRGGLYTTKLVKGFGSELMGRHLIEPVDKRTAVGFLGMMYRLAEEVKSEGINATFDALLHNLDREQQLMELIAHAAPQHPRLIETISLNEVIKWYVAHDIQLSGPYLKLLPPYIREVTEAFDQYWQPITGEDGTRFDAEVMLNKMVQLEFRAFPPGTRFDEAKEELEAALNKSESSRQRVDWERLENLFWLYEQYADIPGVSVDLFRALPGSLKQTVPYHVLQLTIHPMRPTDTPLQIAIGENPLTNNATYIYKEQGDKWEAVFGFEKPDARQMGAIRLWHKTEKGVDHHRQKIVDRLAQLHPKLLAARMAQSRRQ